MNYVRNISTVLITSKPTKKSMHPLIKVNIFSPSPFTIVFLVITKKVPQKHQNFSPKNYYI